MSRESLKNLSDAELAQVLRAAEDAFWDVRDEIKRRFEDKLKAAYGDELRFVDDIYMGVDRTSFRDPEIIWCWYCGVKPGWQREHQIPVSRGGGEGTNVVRSCRGCNHAKRNMTVEEYRARLTEHMGHLVVFHGEKK